MQLNESSVRNLVTLRQQVENVIVCWYIACRETTDTAMNDKKRIKA
jgi:hypothetical protein